MSRSPCKSPDCAPERDLTAPCSNTALSGWVGLRVFLERTLFFAVTFFADFFFVERLRLVTFLLGPRLDFVTFLLFFLVAILAV